MRYSAKLPDESVNISSQSVAIVAFKLMISLALIAIFAYFAIGFIIDQAVTSITPQQEKKLEKILAVDSNLSKKSTPYLKKLTKKLEKCADLPYDIQVAILDEKEANAFAAPGGWIYITQGLLNKAKSENELAFIIGHELGHFKHRDHLRALGYRLVFGLLNLLFSSDYGVASAMTLDITSSRYSQSAELEADRFGLEVMQCAYGTVAGSTHFFERMDEGNEWRYFVATHPGFKKRVERLKEIIKQQNYNDNKKLIPLGKVTAD